MRSRLSGRNLRRRRVRGSRPRAWIVAIVLPTAMRVAMRGVRSVGSIDGPTAASSEVNAAAAIVALTRGLAR